MSYSILCSNYLKKFFLENLRSTGLSQYILINVSQKHICLKTSTEILSYLQKTKHTYGEILEYAISIFREVYQLIRKAD